mgnify:CR=1 FL=1
MPDPQGAMRSLLPALFLAALGCAPDATSTADGLAASPSTDRGLASPASTRALLEDARAAGVAGVDDLALECTDAFGCVVIAEAHSDAHVAELLVQLEQVCAARGTCSVWLSSIHANGEMRRAELVVARTAR